MSDRRLRAKAEERRRKAINSPTEKVYSRSTPLVDIFKKDGIATDLRVSDAWMIRASPSLTDVFGTILMACELEQVAFLNHLWSDRWQPDPTITATWHVVSRRGLITEFWSPSNSDTLERFHTLHACTEVGVNLGRLGYVPTGERS